MNTCLMGDRAFHAFRRNRFKTLGPLGIDGPGLVANYKSRLRAATAAEINSAPQDLDVIKLVELTLQSCARIHANAFDP